MKTDKLIATEEQFGAHNYHPLDIVIRKAEGVWVEDVEGRRYMDFLAAYSAVNQGHCHPRLVKALKKQAARVTLTSRAFRNDQLPHFCEEVCALTGFAKVLPMNSGAEAVETAVKAARKWGEKVKGIAKDKCEIIVCADNFQRQGAQVHRDTGCHHNCLRVPFNRGPYAVKRIAWNVNGCKTLQRVQGSDGCTACSGGIQDGGWMGAGAMQHNRMGSKTIMIGNALAYGPDGIIRCRDENDIRHPGNLPGLVRHIRNTAQLSDPPGR